MTDKKCSWCHEYKPLDEFHFSKGAKDGRHAYCKSCQKTRGAAYYKAHREEKIAYANEWIKRNPEKHAEIRKKYMRKYRHGVEPTRPEPSHCEICGELAKGKGMHLDHCHKTKTFRGWLCHNCNIALGNAKDDPRILCKMISYLMLHTGFPLQSTQTSGFTDSRLI